jgi:hypothetical protein
LTTNHQPNRPQVHLTIPFHAKYDLWRAIEIRHNAAAELLPWLSHPSLTKICNYGRWDALCAGHIVMVMDIAIREDFPRRRVLRLHSCNPG